MPAWRRTGVRRRAGLAAGLVATALAATAAAWTAAGAPVATACPEQRPGPGYARAVDRALRAKEDVWGNELLRASGGPTDAAVRRRLRPLLLARGRGGRPLTDSGVHYVPFAQPLGVQGAGSVALHVADGGQIVSQRVGGRTLTVGVGSGGRERYGSCLARLGAIRLADGWLPILQTRYVDAAGVRYAQESFAARLERGGPLVSFVRLSADPRRARPATAHVRFSTSDGRGVTSALARGAAGAIHVAWPHRPGGVPAVVAAGAYEAARSSVVEYWRRRLAEGTTFVVPERRVLDAERSLLAQNLALTWRYSIGNPYEQFSFPESVDVAQVLSAYGHGGVAAAILRTSLGRRPTPYPNWKMGEKLLGSALHYRLLHDRAYVERATPVLRGYVSALGRQLRSARLLQRERYSSDIPDSVYGLHSQAVAWQGLRGMGEVWRQTGHAALAGTARALAARLERGLRQAVRDSRRRLPDDSLFLPVRLLDREQPYDALTASRAGSYWNLVAPYALASGLFPPRGAEARGALRYLLRHGSRLLGLVRAGAFSLYRPPVYPQSGTDQVYGLNVARFLADNDVPDQLVLSLYGQLGAAMTPGTFVAGEAASVAPLGNDAYRSMYLPPNAAANAAFLETLRLSLVHETLDRSGRPRGLELAFATPRAWLRAGRRIAVEDAPTSFGPLSYSIESSAREVRVKVEVPARSPLRELRLRLRLPAGERIADATLGGRAWRRLDRATQTFSLPARPGTLELVAGRARG